MPHDPTRVSRRQFLGASAGLAAGASLPCVTAAKDDPSLPTPAPRATSPL